MVQHLVRVEVREGGPLPSSHPVAVPEEGVDLGEAAGEDVQGRGAPLLLEFVRIANSRILLQQ